MAGYVPFLFIAGSVVILILFGLFRLRQAHRNHELLRDAARKLGLEFKHSGDHLNDMVAEIKSQAPTTPEARHAKQALRSPRMLGLMQQLSLLAPWQMHGDFQGVPVRIERMQRGSRNRKRTYTRITVAFNEPLDWGLQVSHEGWLDRMATALGGEDVQIGGRQSELDKLVRIRIGAGPAGDAGGRAKRGAGGSDRRVPRSTPQGGPSSLASGMYTCAAASSTWVTCL